MLGNEYKISNGKSFKRRRPNIHPLQKLNERPIEDETGFTGKQKAAMLLASLDSETAAELIKDMDPEAVHELAEELRHLDAAGLSSERQGLKFAQQFCNSLQPSRDFRISGFFKEVMKRDVGVEQTERIQSNIQEVLVKNDPFESIYSAEPGIIAEVLGNEHPQTAAAVLLNMPKEKVSEVLNLFDWGIRISIASRMCDYGLSDVRIRGKNRETEAVCSNSDTNTAVCAGHFQARNQKTEAVCSHPAPNTVSSGGGLLPKESKQSGRKLAVALRNLGKEVRNGLLGIIRINDKQTGKMVSDLMIFWDDILQISNRSLQKALKKVDVKKLALALVKADNQIVQKIQSNITKPMAAVLNEQMLLFSAYKRTEIEQAREEIVDILREMNEKSELSFI